MTTIHEFYSHFDEIWPIISPMANSTKQHCNACCLVLFGRWRTQGAREFKTIGSIIAQNLTGLRFSPYVFTYPGEEWGS